MTDLQRFGLKLFWTDPAAVNPREFVPIFHTWIQQQSIEGHLLIDVHDYSHIHHGPGVLLVSHEANFSIDAAGGRTGLLYVRKQSASGSLEDRLTTALKTLFQMRALLEDEPRLQGKVRFRRDELLLIANDRLVAPNDAAELKAVMPALSTAFGADARFSHVSTDSRDRLAIQVQDFRSAFL